MKRESLHPRGNVRRIAYHFVFAASLLFGSATASAQSSYDEDIAKAVEGMLEFLDENHKERLANDPSYRALWEANRLYSEQKFAEAVEKYAEALRAADGNDSVNLINARYGFALVLTNRPREALDALDSSIERSIGMGDQPWVQLAKGMAHAMTGELSLAMEWLTKSINGRPNPLAYRYRGSVYYQMKDYEAALADYREVQRLAPTMPGINEAIVVLEESAASERFLVQMAAGNNATRTPSGMVYIELESGSGPMPTATDKVKINYSGMLRDGSEVMSDTNFSVGLELATACWTEGVTKMKVGGRSRLGCPASLVYGDRGTPQIPGGAAVVFEVALLAIE